MNTLMFVISVVRLADTEGHCLTVMEGRLVTVTAVLESNHTVVAVRSLIQYIITSKDIYELLNIFKLIIIDYVETFY